MTSRRGTVVQIGMYPMDVRHVEVLLPHQIRTWGPMADRILVTIDTHQSRSGRYRGQNFQQSLVKLRQIVEGAQRTYPTLQIEDVDYSDAAQCAVAQYFFGKDSIPIKAWDGGPFYSYFYGLYAAHAQYVLHLDGDMMFGGSSTSWMRESIACMEERPDVLMMAPFPGPPRTDGKIFGHQLHAGFNRGIEYKKEASSHAAYRHLHVSTRAFMIDLNRFKEQVGVLESERPSQKQRLKARLLGNPPDALEAEVLLSRMMQRLSLYRIDLLGGGPGLWSLHPPYRSEEFYRRLPELVAAVETGNVPDAQRGHYDLNDSMIDWTQARAANHWHRRYLKIISHRLASVA